MQVTPNIFTEYVMCIVNVMPANSFLLANTTEFQRRAHFITGNHHRHVYEPLMKRCLDEHPPVRGTFEDVKKDLSVHLSKYGAKQAQKLEEVLVRHSSQHLYVVVIVIGHRPTFAA